MIRSLWLDNFTTFSTTGEEEEGLEFSDGLNVIIGPNETGKSHLLKIVYCLAWFGAEAKKNPLQATPERLAEKLRAVFKVEGLGRLTRRAVGVQSAHVGTTFSSHKKGRSFGFSFSSRGGTLELDSDKTQQLFGEEDSPIFIPSREVISLFPGFAALYDKYEIELDETHRDLCQLLSLPARRGKTLQAVKAVQKPLTDALHGKVTLKGNRFTLTRPGGGNFEMHLVAEGVRKFAMLLHLINTGALNSDGMLLWDEPETNLNPRLLRNLAKALFALSQLKDGAQVIIATHSYFLLKELDLLRREAILQGEMPKLTFMSLSQGTDGVQLHRAPTLLGLEDIVSLEEETQQYEREEAIAAWERVAASGQKKGKG